MSKLKKIIFAVFVSLSLVAAIWAYFSIKKLKSPKVEAFTVLPDSCAIYLNANDFNELSNKINGQSLVIEKLKSLEQIQKACDLVKQFDSIFNSNELLKEELKDKLIHFAMYHNCHDWLLSFNTKQTGTDKAVREQLDIIFNTRQVKEEIMGYTIQEQKLYVSVANDIICISNQTSLLKNAANVAFPKFCKSQAYLNFKSALQENNLCNVFISNKNLKQKADNDKAVFFEGMEMAGSLVFEPSEIKLNGNLKVDSNHVLAAFVNEEAQASEDFIDVLPQQMHHMVAYGFGSYSKVKERLQKHYPDKLKDFWRDKKDKALYNIEKDFYDNLSGQLVSFESDNYKSSFLALGIRDADKAPEHLGILFDSLLTFKSGNVYTFQQGEEKALFSPLFQEKMACAAIHEKYIVFAQNIDDLNRLLEDYDNNRKIESNENFVNYKNENFLSNYNYLVYYSPRVYSKDINNYLNFKHVKNHSAYDNLKHFSFAVLNGKNSFDFRMQLLNQAENKANEQNALWTSNLDTTVSSMPAAFVNHHTGENEIAVQDDKGNLYLLNARGAKLWQRPIGEKIISPIYMVDVFRNDKFQLLFNTKNHIYLIDRNGKDVSGFPAKLPHPATSALSLLDYNKDKKYRMFVACNNNVIYNFNEQGKLQEGFEPVKTESEVKLPIQYFKVGANEYLVALDVEGKIYTFGRKGQAKIGLRNRTIRDCKAFHLNSTDVLATSSLIYYDDKNSLINKVNFNDKKDVVKLDIESITANATFDLVDDNREYDMIVAQEKKLYVYDLNGDLLHELKSEADIDEANYYSDETNTIFSLFNKADAALEVHELKNQNLKNIKSSGLPLILNLFNDNKIYLILSYGNQISCVPVN